MPRRLTGQEIDGLLALRVPARLGTVDVAGYPHVTPLWLIWADDAFWMTSLVGKPHVGRLRENSRACVLVDIEGDERADGQLPNRQGTLPSSSRMASPPPALSSPRFRWLTTAASQSHTNSSSNSSWLIRATDGVPETRRRDQGRIQAVDVRSSPSFVHPPLESAASRPVTFWGTSPVGDHRVVSPCARDYRPSIARAPVIANC
ncbi:MAG: pyridoxamine 5'-phosphate oxidase family protein [Chloroflexi bacterium]|nr:pyridoxamine 5'-phosphate oxidase family protein [Chloroflexota bacterium]